MGWARSDAPRPSSQASADQFVSVFVAQKKEKRHITFSKRKAGIMKKVSRFSRPAGRPAPCDASRAGAPVGPFVGWR